MPQTPGFDLTTFDIHWASLNSQARTELISRAGFYPPKLGILPILKGLFSYQFKARIAAQESLTSLLSAINQKLDSPSDIKGVKQGQKESVNVGAKIYQTLTREQAFADKSLLFSTLIALGESGSFFAFKALYQGRLPIDVLKKCVQNMTDYQRLVFVDQYLQATPAIRLKFASIFRTILLNIQDRESVIQFYADLFDRKRDIDPFLKNIDDEFRNPESILEQEIASLNPDSRVRGLKALSMMQARIDDRVLKNALWGDEVKSVRIAVYNLIENSSMGLYPQLFEPVFQCLVQGDTNEAIHAFKALVVTGKYPFYKLISLIRKTRPEILPIIYLEISNLSRLSFFAVQDIALNKEAYQGDNFDVNLACIFGMLKKRPERVVKILKTYQDKKNRKTSTALSGFITKTTRLLLKERKSIESGFKTIQTVLPEPEKPKSFFRTVFKDPVQKKLTQLREQASIGSLDFSRAGIKGEDLTGQQFLSPEMLFVRTLFEDCNLSGVQVLKAAFQKAIFYNVNMDGAVFDQVSFDNALFVNVSAVDAVFNMCSFHGASFFNCNFNKANLSDGMFINAVISKTSFSQADLTCASFAYARISGGSFTTANLNMADFTQVNARFCRFPPYSRQLIRTQGIDYNAREYQLSFNDLPRIAPGVAREINMLIFCEFIHYGEGKFQDQNKLSLLTAFDIFKPVQADFFLLLPLMIHENFWFLDQDPLPVSTPCGIVDYLPSRETLRVGEKYLGKNQVAARRKSSPFIQGLFSMGSVGSLAQTGESDIDYWVCIDDRTMEREEVGLLRKKLESLESLVFEKFKIHVTFFIVDILKARNNDFGGSTQESSGSAQSRLLKEEFYRTMIHVAGKLPLWAVLPTTISLNYYNLILDRTSKLRNFNRYIDLGDIHAIPVNEYFGASIWQMFKGLKSPFKSVIKMALLEKYIHAYGQETLLCNQYKNEWMNSGTHLKAGQNDSYIILLNTLIAFYLKVGDERSINLLLTCFFLKLGISKQAEIDYSDAGLRRILLEQSLSEWGWTFQKVLEIGRFKMWPYAAIHRLSLTIERYMVSKYEDLKKRFDTQSGAGLMISEEDRIVLERKVDVVFQNKEDKIKKLLLVSRGDRHFSRLHLKYLPGTDKCSERWGLIHKIPKQQQINEESIITADTIEEIGAWLINNRLYTEGSFLGLVPNPSSISHDDIEKLCRSMHSFFSPEMNKTIHFNAMRRPPIITCLFISVNFYTEKSQISVSDYAAIYLNSWGEMYLKSARPNVPLQNLEEAKQVISQALGLKQYPENTVFYFSRGTFRH